MAFKKIILLAFISIFILFFLSPVTFTLEPYKSFTQQKKQKIPKPTYEVEVIVTNVHVIVTDKKGNRIIDLKPENFEIYEDGLLQKLTNFYEVKEMEVYASVPEKEKEKPLKPLPESTFQMKNKIIIYFDNWHLHPLNRNWSIKKLESFIRNNFSPENNNNQGMVVSLDQKLEILQEFTSNEGQLLHAINQVKKRSGQSLLRARAKEDMRKELNRMATESTQISKYDNYDRTLGYARSYVEAERNDLIYSMKSLNAFTDHLIGIEGKKILIYVSDGLPINPGEEVFTFLDQAFPVGNARAEAMNYNATKIFKEMTARCNANEIALYPINAKGLESMTLSADKQAGWNVYSRGSGMVKPTSRITDDALKLMAHDTGGLAILNTNDIDSGLERIEDDLQFYYSLGYVSPHREDNKYHSIQVKLVGVGEKYNIRLRHGYMRISQEEKIKESISSRLFLQREYNPMNIIVQAMPVEPRPGSKRLRLTLKILIPIKNLTLYPQDDNYIGQIKVYMALMDSANNISPCHELTEDIKIPSKDYEIAVKSRYPYLAEMYVDPSNYTISLAVKDVPSDIINYIQLEKTVEPLK
ncbi:MAG: VWA domain-containing protein [Candidatus Aminicenantes bacterium]|nr:MAG: VWA domain-containing protein [Candidatus Aminicenantes bacterium]